MMVNFPQLRKGNHLAVISGLSFALVPSKEDYFLSASGYNANAPKPHIFKVEPVPSSYEENPQNSGKGGGVLSNVGEFIGKGVQAIKDLVNPDGGAGKPSTSYGTPGNPPLTSYQTPVLPYSLGKTGSFKRHFFSSIK